MSKVFEALQRQQQNQERQESRRDPLAAITGAPDALTGHPDATARGEDVSADDEPPILIGAPTGPRSNEGMIFSPGSSGPSSQSAAPPAPGVNGKLEPDHRAHHQQHQHPAAAADRSAAASARRSAAELRAAVSALRQAQIDQTKGQREPIETPEVVGPEEPPQPARTPREITVEHLSLSRLHPRLILLTEPHAVECEQYRTLRTQLFHAAEKKQTQVITVTSALAGEGKTSTVLNLALAIAQSKEKRVLIIDGDLRRPNIASYLGLQPKIGLAETLSGKTEALNTIFCLDGQELYVLPVSGESENPTELLSSERLGETIKLLRGYFDFILIDSPPIMPFADSRLLANHADAVIMVVRSGMTPYETVEKAIDALPAGRILGVVLNSAEHQKEAGYYDYYYNYSKRERRRQSFRERLAQRVRRSWVGRKMKL